MSHHFDSEAARSDPRIDLCDLYAFLGGSEGTVAIVLTVHPHAPGGDSATFRPDAAYDIHVQAAPGGPGQSAAARWRATFGEPDALGGQDVTLEASRGQAGAPHAAGVVLAQGRTGESIEAGPDGRFWAGPAADPFFFSTAYGPFSRAAYEDGILDPGLLADPSAGSFFGDSNVLAIALELPIAALGVADGPLWLWSTTSVAHGDRFEPVQRHAIPVVQLLFNRLRRSATPTTGSGPDADADTYGPASPARSPPWHAPPGTPIPKDTGSVSARRCCRTS
jgi:hypothetical protein